MDQEQIILPTFSELYHKNPAAVTFTIAFVLIIAGTLYFYLTIRHRQRHPTRRKSFQSVRDAVEYSQRVKTFIELVKQQKNPPPPPPYKPLVGGLPPRRGERPAPLPVDGKGEPPKPLT